MLKCIFFFFSFNPKSVKTKSVCVGGREGNFSLSFGLSLLLLLSLVSSSSYSIYYLLQHILFLFLFLVDSLFLFFSSLFSNTHTQFDQYLRLMGGTPSI